MTLREAIKQAMDLAMETGGAVTPGKFFVAGFYVHEVGVLKVAEVSVVPQIDWENDKVRAKVSLDFSAIVSGLKVKGAHEVLNKQRAALRLFEELMIRFESEEWTMEELAEFDL
jgi:hypothetical protein